jgi:hypothetical protein
MVAALRKPSAQRATKVDKMSRNRILAAGALLWTVAIVDGLAHFVSGDLIAPALMAVLGIAGASWIVLRRGRRSLSEDS